jgi:Sec-independent protein translocase protein TatA
MENISWGEVFLVLFVVYIFFGVKIIPKLIRNFKDIASRLQKAMHEIRKEVK